MLLLLLASTSLSTPKSALFYLFLATTVLLSFSTALVCLVPFEYARLLLGVLLPPLFRPSSRPLAT